jgi:ribonuclease T
LKLCYIVADVEASCGTVLPPDNNMISLGACVAGRPEQTFYAEFRLVFPDKWEDSAERIHGLSRDYLRRNGEEPARALRAFWRWVQSVSLADLPVFCAKPVGFDFGHVSWYLNHFGLPDPFGGRTLDTRDLYRKVMGLEKHESVTVDQMLRDFPTTLTHTHNALDDALELEAVMRQMLVRDGRL